MIVRVTEAVEFVGPDGPPRRCVGCGYVLEHLAERGECPECGRTFDLSVPQTYDRRPPFKRWTFWLPGMLTAVGGGVLTDLLLVPLIGWGWATTLAVPFVVGVLLGYRVRMGVLATVVLVVLAVGALCGTLLSLSVTGGLCTVVLACLALAPALLGALAGRLLRAELKASTFSQRGYLPLAFLLLPPLLGWMEGRHRGMAVVSTSTVATINATPEQTWAAIQFYEQVRHRPPLLLWVSPSLRPQSTSGRSEKVGDRKVCVYARGRLVKEVTQVVPCRRLAFRVVEQAEIENDGVRLIDGSFELTPTADGRGTTVTLTTRYEPRLAPRLAYRAAEDLAVHTLHGHVLRGMKEDAERAGR